MEEHFDILDKQGNKTGLTCPRSQAHAQGLWHRTAHIWALDTNKRILLQKRASTKDTFAGFWDISAAGHLSAGQEPLDAAQREFLEELGLNLPTDRFMHFAQLQTQTHLPNSSHHSLAELHDCEWHNVYWVILSTDEVVALQPDPLEVTELAWLSQSELEHAVTHGYQGAALVPHPQEYPLLFELLQNL